MIRFQVVRDPLFQAPSALCTFRDLFRSGLCSFLSVAEIASTCLFTNTLDPNGRRMITGFDFTGYNGHRYRSRVVKHVVNNSPDDAFMSSISPT